MKPEFLFRMRRTDALLSKHEELERQEVYFCPASDLNDPIEGFKDLYWIGDTIVWRNLLRHYLLCLERVYILAILGGNEQHFDGSHIPALTTDSDLPTENYKTLFKEICDRFFSNEVASHYPNWLGSLNRPIRRNELLYYLRLIHLYALSIVVDTLERHKLIPPHDDDNPLRQVGTNGLTHPEKLAIPAELFEKHPEKLERFYATFGHIDLQSKLLIQYNAPEKKNKTWKLVLLEFPQEYLKSLESVVHPPWYAACFMDSFSNASTWGHYADGHKGVCLKFKTTALEHNAALNLHGINGWGGSKDKSGPIYGNVKFPFYEVNYSGKFPEIDFFKSLGRLPISKIYDFWYRGEKGETSSVFDQNMFNESWRKKYWSEFHAGLQTKLKDWAYEREYRLVTSGTIIDREEKEHRKFKYKFEDLEAIIFGIRTSTDDKLAIMSIIQKKCRDSERKNFDFYQAFYSKESGNIEATRLSLLQPNINARPQKKTDQPNE